MAISEGQAMAGISEAGQNHGAVNWLEATFGTKFAQTTNGIWVTPNHLCPDLLRWENLGPADNLRGNVVRGFFWVLRVWKP